MLRFFMLEILISMAFIAIEEHFAPHTPLGSGDSGEEEGNNEEGDNSDANKNEKNEKAEVPEPELNLARSSAGSASTSSVVVEDSEYKDKIW